MIIHIAGTAGSGKTYIGELFKKNINVIDIDDWMEEFSNINKNTKKLFISFIKNKINKLDNNKINLLVGYLDCYIGKKIIFYPLIADYKFFIKISPKQLYIQYNLRLVNYICKNKEEIKNNITKYNFLPPFKTINDLINKYNNDINDYINNLDYKLYSSKKIINFISDYNQIS